MLYMELRQLTEFNCKCTAFFQNVNFYFFERSEVCLTLLSLCPSELIMWHEDLSRTEKGKHMKEDLTCFSKLP